MVHQQLIRLITGCMYLALLLSACNRAFMVGTAEPTSPADLQPTDLPPASIVARTPRPITETTILINETQTASQTAAQLPATQSQQDCPPFTSASLELRLNELNQVLVYWDVQGGCAPYNGKLTAWYQDEFKPYAEYPIASTSGRLVDAPILHIGLWDIDYYLELGDAKGNSITTMKTIADGR